MTEKERAKRKIDKYFAEYEIYTDKLSDVCRQLAFAEGGAFWILKPSTGNISTIIILGLFSLVLYFILDTLQYYFGKVDYEKLAEKYKKKLKDNPGMKSSDIKKGDVNKRAEFCFNTKIILIGITSIILGIKFAAIFIYCHG